MMEEDFVVLADAVPDVILEIHYYSTYNFVGERIDGYEEPIALLTRPAAEALKAVSDEMVAQGYRLKIYDAYRPQRAVNHFVRWAENIDDTRMKCYFYPKIEKKSLFDMGFIAMNSSHSRGSTVDLTLFDMKTGAEMDMGSPFDYFGKRSLPTFFKKLNIQQVVNRRFLKEAMERHGFKQLDTEWWHFTLENEPFPDTYFDFPVSKAAIGKS